jgi:hypothetical protein
MTTPGAYPPGPASQGAPGLIIAATPGEALAEALAAELRALGWRATVAEQLAPHASEARACVALVTPATLSSPALTAALATQGTPLIPLIVGRTPLPSGPWAAPPIAFSGDPAQAARDIVAAADALAGAPGSGAEPTLAYKPASSSQPLPPYPAPVASPSLASKRPGWPVIIGVIATVALVSCMVGAFGYARLKSPSGTVSVEVEQTETAQAFSATATAEAAVTPIIPSNFTLYTDTVGAYNIAYPQGWQKTTSGGDIIFLDADDTADMVIGSVAANIPQSEIKATEAQYFKTVAGSGTYSHVQGPIAVTYAGETWQQESADITSAGQTFQAVVLIANHGPRAYIIGYVAPKAGFSSLDLRFFQIMLHSFAFL